jgi:hypothetical protein
MQLPQDDLVVAQSQERAVYTLDNIAPLLSRRESRCMTKSTQIICTSGSSPKGEQMTHRATIVIGFLFVEAIVATASIKWAHAQATGKWYYCDPAHAYYPYVRTCPVPWREVAPSPNPTASPKASPTEQGTNCVIAKGIVVNMTSTECAAIRAQGETKPPKERAETEPANTPTSCSEPRACTSITPSVAATPVQSPPNATAPQSEPLPLTNQQDDTTSDLVRRTYAVQLDDEVLRARHCFATIIQLTHRPDTEDRDTIWNYKLGGGITCGGAVFNILTIMGRPQQEAHGFIYALFTDEWSRFVGATPTAKPSSASRLEPTITITVEKPSRPTIVGTTNLPDGTELMITVRRIEVTYLAQSTVIVSGSHFRSEQFDQSGHDLPSGTYTVEITMPIAEVQPDRVKAVIGRDGENLAGPLVKSAAFGLIVIEYTTTFDVSLGN